METQGQDLTGKINHLIALAEDGRFGYESAAKDVKDSYLKSLFIRLSAERDGYITELQDQLHNIGGEPKAKGGPVGAIHRAWINIKAAITMGDRNAIIKECITGEEYAIKEYQAVIDTVKPIASLKEILTKQHSGIQSALSSIKLELDRK